MSSVSADSVVDDEAGIRCLIHDLLEDEGSRVLVAMEGVTALAVAQCDPPDLVVSDLMPGMDECTLAARLHSAPATAHIPVILISATYYSRPGNTFAAVIHKLFDLDVLLHAIRTHMS